MRYRLLLRIYGMAGDCILHSWKLRMVGGRRWGWPATPSMADTCKYAIPGKAGMQSSAPKGLCAIKGGRATLPT